jgi:hypothetical protein
VLRAAVDAHAARRVDVHRSPRRDHAGGHAGDAVLWYTPEGGPTTSPAYTGSAIPFAKKFAQNNPTPGELTGEWKKLLPDDAYQNEDDGPGEHPPDGWTATFPHPLTLTRTDGQVMSYWQSTPAADTFLAHLAMAAVDELKLGHEHLDYLAVSFSEVDTTGHAFGPTYEIRTSCCAWIARSASCSITSTRRSARAATWWRSRGSRRRPAARAPQGQGEDAGRVNVKPLAIELDAALSARWGRAPTSAGSSTPTSTSRPASTPGSRRTPPRWPRSSASSSGRRHRQGVPDRSGRAAPAPGDDPALVALRSRVPDRTGDIFLVPRPFWLMTANGTTHGAAALRPRVPVLLFGRASSGTLRRRVAGGHRADARALAGVHMPKTDGRVLREARAERRPAGNA